MVVFGTSRLRVGFTCFGVNLGVGLFQTLVPSGFQYVSPSSAVRTFPEHSNKPQMERVQSCCMDFYDWGLDLGRDHTCKGPCMGKRGG